MLQLLHKYLQTRVSYHLYCIFLIHPVSIWDPTMGFYKKIYIILDLFSFRAWGWTSQGRNMSPWQYTDFMYMNKTVVLWTDTFVYPINFKLLNFLSHRVYVQYNKQRPLVLYPWLVQRHARRWYPRRFENYDVCCQRKHYDGHSVPLVHFISYT